MPRLRTQHFSTRGRKVNSWQSSSNRRKRTSSARPLLEAHRDELLDALQDEAEDDIVTWPLAYRRWLVQTIAFALREGFDKRDAFWMSYRDVRAALDADRARVIAEAAEDGMLRAALDSGFVTIDQVAAGFIFSALILAGLFATLSALADVARPRALYQAG